MAVNSVAAFISVATIAWKLVFNCHGLQDPTPPSSALPLSTIWTRMLLFVPRSTTSAKSGWDINRSCVTVRKKNQLIFSTLFHSTNFYFLGITLTLSTLIDGKNFNAGGHKIGVALELEA